MEYTTVEGLIRMSPRAMEVGYTADDILEFRKTVNDLIKERWEPIGGISTSYDRAGDMRYVQAMVRGDADMKRPLDLIRDKQKNLTDDACAIYRKLPLKHNMHGEESFVNFWRQNKERVEKDMTEFLIGKSFDSTKEKEKTILSFISRQFTHYMIPF